MTQLPHSSILLPLYVYPAPGNWDPLYAAIEQHAHLSFIVIVNPSSGPGSAPWWPNIDYVREIPKLNAYSNVKTVGYIGTTYCRKPIEEVYADIDKYAKWSGDERYPGLGVSGIFFDETLNVYTEADGAYLESITKWTKETEGILGDRLVIHNPGTSVDSRLAQSDPDITTTAEIAYVNFDTQEYQEWLATSPYERGQTSYMIHGTPAAKIEGLVLAMRERAAYLFVTDLSEGYYQSFSPHWTMFVDAMSKDASLEAGFQGEYLPVIDAASGFACKYGRSEKLAENTSSPSQ